jgi:hypothetical protein
MTNLIRTRLDGRVNRGVTLLMVLALMTMFSVLVITFMLVTSSAKKMAISHAHALLNPATRDTENKTKDSNEAFERILFGDTQSNIRSLSILENLYGNLPVEGAIDSFTISSTNTNYRLIGFSGGLADANIGYVLTLTSFNHPAALTPVQQETVDKYKNRSVLIKYFNQNSSGALIEVEKFSDTDVVDFASISALGTWNFIINSPAFSGTGEGFVMNATTSTTTAPLPTTALSATATSQNVPRVFLPNLPDYGDNVMMNPDYTAPDHLTWFLAWYDVNSSGGIANIIPSFHRPKLIGNIISPLTSDPTNIPDIAGEVLTKATLRPLPIEHPNFTGSNYTATVNWSEPSERNKLIAFLTGNGEWDVDNDGDGIKDSIWLDVDLPTYEDKRKSTTKPITVKPLISVLIRDLDGLLNVNAHGNISHTVTTPPVLSINGIGGVHNSGERGLGMGPAEVELNHDDVLGIEVVVNSAGDEKIKIGNRIIAQRNTISSSSDSPAGVDRNSYAGAGAGRLYPDFWGFAPIAFEPMGYRFFDLSTSADDIYRNNPYMTNVYSNRGNPFKVDELESFLRSSNDVDSSQFLHGLKDLFIPKNDPTDETLFNLNRYSITTHSSNIPAISRIGGYKYTTSSASPPTYAVSNQLNLFDKINQYTSSYPANYQIIIDNLPPEIRRGEKINLNKVTNMTTVQKSEFAHQLFLLMMVICYDKIEATYTISTTPTREQAITRLAQWAVNVVDFIDADAIMTPLVFSCDPFQYSQNYLPNGYLSYIGINFFTEPPALNTPDTNMWANTQRRIVFGKEDNDLFITKTFATHNRNTADSKLDNTGNGVDGKPKGYVNTTSDHDHDFDQIFKPEGSLFVELYRAADPTRQRTTGEFYDIDNKLDLAKLNDTGEPVWRIAIGQPTKSYPKDTLPTSNARNFSIVNRLENGEVSKFQPQQWNTLGAIAGDTNFCDSKAGTIRPERFIFFVDNPTFANSRVSPDLNKRAFVNIGTVVEKDSTVTPGTKVKVNDVADTKLKPNEFFLIAPRVMTSFKSNEVTTDAAITEFGIPNGSDETKVDLNDFIGNPRVKTMVAAIKSKELADSSGEDYYWNNDSNSNPNSVLMLGFYADGGSIEPKYCGVGANISEPLPTANNMTTTNKYYPKPTNSPNNKDTYPATSNEFKTPTYAIDDAFVKGFGTIPGFRSMFLQRLADTQRPYHPVTNPYITVDWSMVDLHVFTSEKTTGNTDHTTGEFAAPGIGSNLEFDISDKLHFNIREWGTTAARSDITSKRPNIRDRSFDEIKTDNIPKVDRADALGNSMTNNYEPPNLPTSGTNRPKWGELPSNYGSIHGTLFNKSAPDSYTPYYPLGTSHPQTDFTGVPEKGFLHFPWNDSPLANTFELMLVPATSASRFGYDCYDSESTTTDYKPLDSLGMNATTRFRSPITNNTSPYLNFFSTNGSLDLVRLFEYVQVPSRFISSRQQLSAMREPGKINLNTMTEKSWIALGGAIAADYATFKESRNPSGGIVEFSQPFRSPQAANFVPFDTMIRPPAATTLLGHLQPTVGDNLYTSLYPILRLSETTTTRSNVFAIWITTGYFEVDKDGKLQGEVGLDDGTIERRRDFYIIDRSIPVGFKRGEKLNTNNVILLKKSLE